MYLKALKFKQTQDIESSNPDSESINESEDSVASFEDDFDIEVEDKDDEGDCTLYMYASRCESSEDIMAYADEPLAGEEWLKKHEAESGENKQFEQELLARLDNAVQAESW